MMCSYVVHQLFMLRKLAVRHSYKGRRTRELKEETKGAFYLPDLDNVT